MAEHIFDAASANYNNYLNTMRGWVRQQVVRANLASTLRVCSAESSTEPLQILDFGGGNAQDAIWLAEQGHAVTIVDISSDQLAQGKAAVSETGSSKVSDLISFHQGGLEALKALSTEKFDLVLSHGVLQYELDNPGAQLEALAATLRHAGRLSLLTKGYVSAERQVLEAIRRPQGPSPLTALEEFRRSSTYQTHANKALAKAYRQEELKELLRENGFWLVEASYGVRVLTDGDNRPHTEVSEEEKTMILESEVAASRDVTNLAAAAMLQLIAVKLATH